MKINTARVDKLILQFSEEEERAKELAKEKEIADKEKKDKEMSEKDQEKEAKKEKDFSERFSRAFSEHSKSMEDRMVAMEEDMSKMLDMCEKQFSKKK